MLYYWLMVCVKRNKYLNYSHHRLITRTTSLLAADEVEDTVQWCDIRAQKLLSQPVSETELT